MTEETATPIVYVDANPFIYYVDGEESVASRVRPFFDFLAKRPGIAMTSELTLAEVLAKARPDARRNYFNLIVWSRLFELKPVTRDILIDTADYRQVSLTTSPDGRKANVNVKLPDAIHVVTASRSRCRLFLSADQGLQMPADMTILRPDQDGFTRLTREIA
jgi:predicted nucleic acid-binding protein